jgi:hypothetical protein
MQVDGVVHETLKGKVSLSPLGTLIGVVVQPDPFHTSATAPLPDTPLATQNERVTQETPSNAPDVAAESTTMVH